MRKLIHLVLIHYFSFAGESVYYCHEAEDTVDHPVKKRLVITTKEEVKPVLEDMHNNQSHQGIVRTQQKVTNEYYWPHVTEDVKKWVRLISYFNYISYL